MTGKARYIPLLRIAYHSLVPRAVSAGLGLDLWPWLAFAPTSPKVQGPKPPKIDWPDGRPTEVSCAALFAAGWSSSHLP